MITFLLLIIPMCIILNRLENSRSRRKVSVDGFKMINGHIVRRES
jgi:flagellar biogenesis protein FliO